MQFDKNTVRCNVYTITLNNHCDCRLNKNMQVAILKFARIAKQCCPLLTTLQFDLTATLLYQLWSVFQVPDC